MCAIFFVGLFLGMFSSMTTCYFYLKHISSNSIDNSGDGELQQQKQQQSIYDQKGINELKNRIINYCNEFYNNERHEERSEVLYVHSIKNNSHHQHQKQIQYNNHNHPSSSSTLPPSLHQHQQQQQPSVIKFEDRQNHQNQVFQNQLNYLLNKYFELVHINNNRRTMDTTE